MQVLDCFTTASVLVLSWIFLKVRYQCVHYSGVVICLVGIICLVIADYYGSRYYGAGGTVYMGHFVDFFWRNCILIFDAKINIQLFQERLLEKVIVTILKGIVGGLSSLFFREI